MTQMVGVGAVLYGTPHGLGAVARVGVGIPGPWGDNPMLLGAVTRVGVGILGPFGDNPQNISQNIPSGTYEITGTVVTFRKEPAGETIGLFNPTQSQRAENIPGDPPDQVDFGGTTEAKNNFTWAYVKVKSGPLFGKTGWVAMKYMAPVGWLNDQINKRPELVLQKSTGPSVIDTSMSTNKGQPTPSPVIDTGASMATVAKSSPIPWIIGGLAIVGVLVGASIMAKKPQRTHHGVAHRAYAHEARRRRYRRRYR